MAIDTRVILGGQGVDGVNAFTQGILKGQAVNDAFRAREYNQTVQQFGAGAAQGDRNALSALAAYDPQAALGLESNLLSMDATRQSMANQVREMEMREDQFQQSLAQFRNETQSQIAQMDADQIAQEREEIGQFLAVGMTLQTPGDWDQYMQTNHPEFVGLFDRSEELLAEYQGLDATLERLADQNPELPASVRALEYRATQAGLQPGSPEWGAFMASGGVPTQSTSIEVGADGGMTFNQGTGAVPGANVSLTAGEANSTGFYGRTSAANDLINEFEGQGSRLGQSIAQQVPGVGNYLIDDEYGTFQNAVEDFIAASLRKESGAAIGEQEQERFYSIFIPEPGDGPDEIARKREARQAMVNALQISAGAGAALIERLTAEQQSGGTTQQSTGVPHIGSQQPQTLSLDVVATMSPAQLNAALQGVDMQTLSDDVLQAIIDRGQ